MDDVFRRSAPENFGPAAQASLQDGAPSAPAEPSAAADADRPAEGRFDSEEDFDDKPSAEVLAALWRAAPESVRIAFGCPPDGY